MTPSIKQRIEQIQCGEVPEGYSMERAMLYPNDWGSEDKDIQKYSHYGRHITAPKGHTLYEIDTLKEMTGYAKNYAWQYENEVRMRIRLHHNTGYEKILIDVPQEVIDSIEITVGPYFKWKNEELFEQLQHEGRIKDSAFRGLVNYRELCSMCQHGSFARK